MRAHHPLLLAAVATGALLVPVERVALGPWPDGPAALYAQALAKEGRGGGSRGRGERGSDRGGKAGGHRGGDGGNGHEARDRDGGHRGKAGHAGGRDSRKELAGNGRHAARDRGDRAKRRFGIRPSDFVGKIDNPYLTLKPGTVFVYRGEDSINKVFVTRRTKKILGVKATVVKDLEFADGELKEKTFDWYAQDKRGNVWYFGEATKEYEGGKVVSTEGSWKAGVNGARPGIVMQGSPEVGQTYQQEVAPGVAEDKARVVSLDAFAKVPYGTFRDALKTYEFSPIDPELQENKFYARGVGQVLTVERVTGEREELVDIRRR